MFRTGIVQYFNLKQAREELELEIAVAEPEKAAALRESLAQLERVIAAMPHLTQPLERSMVDQMLS